MRVWFWRNCGESLLHLGSVFLCSLDMYSLNLRVTERSESFMVATLLRSTPWRIRWWWLKMGVWYYFEPNFSRSTSQLQRSPVLAEVVWSAPFLVQQEARFLPRNDKAYVLLSAGWMKGSQWIEWSYYYAFETQWNILLTCLTPCLWFPSPWKKHRQPKKNILHYGLSTESWFSPKHNSKTSRINNPPGCSGYMGLCWGQCSNQQQLGYTASCQWGSCQCKPGFCAKDGALDAMGELGKYTKPKAGCVKRLRILWYTWRIVHRHGILIYIYTSIYIYDVCHVL